MASVRPEDSFCAPDFWKCLNALPEKVRKLAEEKHRLWLEDTTTPGLDFKPMKGQSEDIWEVYVGKGHRAFCVKDGTTYVWFWIGTKQEAVKTI